MSVWFLIWTFLIGSLIHIHRSKSTSRNLGKIAIIVNKPQRFMSIWPYIQATTKKVKMMFSSKPIQPWKCQAWRLTLKLYNCENIYFAKVKTSNMALNFITVKTWLQPRGKIDKWGAKILYICVLQSAPLISFEIDCFNLWYVNMNTWILAPSLISSMASGCDQST